MRPYVCGGIWCLHVQRHVETPHSSVIWMSTMRQCEDRCRGWYPSTKPSKSRCRRSQTSFSWPSECPSRNCEEYMWWFAMTLLAPVGRLGQSVPPYNGVQFSLHATLDVGVQQHHEEDVVERRTGGLGSGNEKVHTDHNQLIDCNRIHRSCSADRLQQNVQIMISWSIATESADHDQMIDCNRTCRSLSDDRLQQNMQIVIRWSSATECADQDQMIVCNRTCRSRSDDRLQQNVQIMIRWSSATGS